MQEPVLARSAQRMTTGFGSAVFGVLQQQQRLMEEHLLCLLLSNAVLFVLAFVPGVPFEFLEPGQIQHNCILPSYTTGSNRVGNFLTSPQPLSCKSKYAASAMFQSRVPDENLPPPSQLWPRPHSFCDQEGWALPGLPCDIGG